jgi:tRNA(Ile)-lysidine synthase
MLARVRRTVARFRMCSPGDRVGVACSGGPDSVALLEALEVLAPELGIRLGVVHLNHGLRGETSDADEAFVEGLAQQKGLAIHVRRADVAALAASDRRNLEDAGRRARYGWFGELIREGIFDRIATGHTRSDQAETVLFRLLRGAGPDGLSAIRPVREPGVIRPLLDVERAGVEAFLAERGLSWRVDESNADLRFARNRLRRDLLPRLERDWNPRTPEALARLAEQAAEDAEYWRLQVADCEERLFRAAPHGLVLNVEDVAALEPALRRRVLRRSLERVGGGGRYDFQHLEALRILVEDPDSGAAVSLPGLVAERSCGRLRLAAAGESEAAVADPLPVSPPEEHGSPDGRTRIRLEIVPPGGAGGRYTKPNWDGIDWLKAPKPLFLRAWRPSDRFCKETGASSRTLSEMLQSSRVSAWDRLRWPVLAGPGEGRIFWARGYGVASEFRPSGNIGQVLRVFEFDDAGRPWTGVGSWEVISAGL